MTKENWTLLRLLITDDHCMTGASEHYLNCKGFFVVEQEGETGLELKSLSFQAHNFNIKVTVMVQSKGQQSNARAEALQKDLQEKREV